MSNRLIVSMFAAMLVAMFACSMNARAQDDRAAYEAKLQAGREAAYQKFLMRPAVPAVTRSAPTGASLAVLKSQVAPAAQGSAPVHVASPATAAIFHSNVTPYAFGDQRYNFYDNLNLLRRQRVTDYPLFPYIYQPTWDWRYRRSWPRPVVVREYVKSHWLWNGARYTFVPGHAQYETQWVVQGWPRYHWNGSHYSVSVSFNR